MQRLHILLIEDNQDDASLLLREIARHGFEPSATRVRSAAEMAEALRAAELDVIVADSDVEGFGCLEALEVLRRSGQDIPFLLVSKTIDSAAAIEAMNAGARDYIKKQDPSRIGPALHRELRDAALRRERMDVERLLIEAERRSARLVEMLPLGVLIIDRAGSIAFSNAAGRLALGFDAGLHGKSFIDFVVEENREEVRHRLAVALSGREASPLEVEMVRLSGSQLVAELTLMPYAPEEGLSLLVMNETTERKYVDRLKSDFVAMVSHELRTPLTMIAGYAQLLQTGRHSDPKSIGNISGKILAGTGQMIGLVERLLTTLALETETLQMSLEPVDLVEIVRRCAEGMPLDERHHLYLDLPHDPVLILGDERSLRVAIDNMLANAVKFSPDGGEVGVVVEQDAESVRVAISDEGIGVAQEVKARVFDRFFQQDMSSTRRFGGFGLGLFVAERVATAHGGTISVADRQPRGSVFTLWLPVADGPAYM